MDYLILALATYRISSLLADEDGPLNILNRLRALVGVRDDDGAKYGANNFATGIICQWCNSVWIGAVLTIAFYFWPAVVWLALPLALSAATIIIERYVMR